MEERKKARKLKLGKEEQRSERWPSVDFLSVKDVSIGDDVSSERWNRRAEEQDKEEENNDKWGQGSMSGILSLLPLVYKFQGRKKERGFMEDSRRVIDYSELWNEASTSSGTGKVTQNGQSMPSSSSSSKLFQGWSADGQPQTASSARKLRKILTKIEVGDIQSAESELAKMGTAKNNYEVQRALALAKTGSNGFGEEDDDDDDEDDYEEDDTGMEDVNNGMNTSASFDWQGAMNSNGKETGRQLTHEEIWDDSALVDAWNAAEEEYKLFHAQRSAHDSNDKQRKRSMMEELDLENPKKKSALWHDSPAKGSLIAMTAKSAQEEQDKASAELIARKKQAKALLAKVAGDEDAKINLESASIAVPLIAPASRKKLKGTTPPSSSISGNLAWHSACATVSKTPNAIGEETESTEILSPTQHAATSPTHAAENGSEDIFQNLAMAWYYAGYYQAMAMNWSNNDKRS